MVCSFAIGGRFAVFLYFFDKDEGAGGDCNVIQIRSGTYFTNAVFLCMFFKCRVMRIHEFHGILVRNCLFNFGMEVRWGVDEVFSYKVGIYNVAVRLGGAFRVDDVCGEN